MKKQKFSELKDLLDAQAAVFNVPDFIKDDPVSIPHLYNSKEDIEISAFLTATISWGRRQGILKNSLRILELMDSAPYHFVQNATTGDFKRFNAFVHRTFNGTDCIYFLKALQQIYAKHGGLENLFSESLRKSNDDMAAAIHHARTVFFSHGLPGRTSKHFADPLRNSSAKRICMFLRWMVRKDKKGVDFGIWDKIHPSLLYCPLDVHSGRIARELGLLQRTQNDWKAVAELTCNLRKFDHDDPVKYDFALFGMGVGEKFGIKN